MAHVAAESVVQVHCSYVGTTPQEHSCIRLDRPFVAPLVRHLWLVPLTTIRASGILNKTSVLIGLLVILLGIGKETVLDVIMIRF